MTAHRVFVITGAGSDIGAALARHLDVCADVDLVLVARRSRPPEVNARHLVLSGINLIDGAHLQRVANAVATTSGSFTLVHCVGDFWEHKPLMYTDPAEIVAMIQSHYLTLALTVQTMLPLAIERKGRFVAFSCNSVQYNYPDMVPFTSAKAAVEVFIKCIANEYSQYGVVANTLALPTILTDKVIKLKALGEHANYVTPDELAALICDTLSAAPQAINGNTLKVFRHSRTFFEDGYFARNPRPSKYALPDP